MLFVLGCDGVKGRDGSEGCQGPPGTAGTYGSILWTVLDKDDQIVSQVGHRYDVEVTHFEVEQKFVIEYCKTHYYRAPFNFTHFALGDDNAYITGADIRSK